VPEIDTPAPTVDEQRRRLATWLWRLPVLAAVGGAVYGLAEVYRVHFNKRAPAAEPRFDPRPDVPIGPLGAFAEPWDAVAFSLGGVPCVALRLPAPIAGALSRGEVHLAAFTRVCTHQGCIVDLNRDTEAIAFAFNHRSDRPQLTCACHYSVFDPVRAGRVVSGPAILPLPRVRLRLDDQGGRAMVVADGLEQVA
jgi:arsenite oxidase small subunit